MRQRTRIWRAKAEGRRFHASFGTELSRELSFADCLAVVRQMLWTEEAVSPILWRDDYPTWRARARTAENPRPLEQRLAELMSYAA